MEKTIIKRKFFYNEAKNTILKETRNIDFKSIVDTLSTKETLQSFLHPNQKKYPNQEIFIVNMQGYFYFVPYIINKEGFFLKTAFRCRKWNKQYLNQYKSKKENKI